MSKLVKNPNIWDLHIHTPLGTPTKKNYDGATTEEFINELLKIYEESSNKIGMISFTDHNKINVEAYKLFKKKSSICILPGIEIDVYLTQKSEHSKHVIFYFDESELENIEELSKIIDNHINEHEKVYFEELILDLISHKKRFAISPHAFKQGKRGINSDWCDEVEAVKGLKQFTGLFFPFWEAGGKSEITKAIEFLEEQYEPNSNKQAVIVFSDSADYSKLRNYLDKPHQYFLCLNSFKGLLLAGSDIDRIIYEYEERPERNPSEKISKISISNNLERRKTNNTTTIEFSDRLNVIVGGRGKGKSALLDAIVLQIDSKKIEDPSRSKFVKKFDVEILNFNNSTLASDINIMYFSQAFINKLFDGSSKNKLGDFFKKQFSEHDSITESILDIKKEFEKNKILSNVEDVNIIDDFKYLTYSKERKNNLSLKKKRVESIPLIVDRNSYSKEIKEILPQNEKIWNNELNEKFNSFIQQLIENICVENYNTFIDAKFNNKMKIKIEEKIKEKSKEEKRKLESKSNIEKKLRFLYHQELIKIRQINKLYSIEKEKTKLVYKHTECSGEDSNKFYFITIANKEHPVEYGKRLIVESVNKSKRKGFDKESNSYIFKEYALSKNFFSILKDSITVSDVSDKINNLDELKAEKIQKIIYKYKDVYLDLHNTSPGMQTNSVMEFILHSDSTVPLFIDQPEDNIDNEARYSQLTRWIRKQKYNRQIFLVSHDANIVINGDAECVIIAERTVDKFLYEYGALEYGDILDKSAVILDGGKTAIHRRIKKYGE